MHVHQFVLDSKNIVFMGTKNDIKPTMSQYRGNGHNDPILVHWHGLQEGEGLAMKDMKRGV